MKASLGCHSSAPSRSGCALVHGRGLLGDAALVRRRLHPGPADTCPGAQAADLRRPKPARATALQLVEANGTHPDADQAVDRGADGPEHPAQLALPALGQDRAIPGQVAGRRAR